MVEKVILGHIMQCNHKDILRVKPQYFTGDLAVLCQVMKVLDGDRKPIDMVNLLDSGISHELMTTCTDAYLENPIVNDSHFTKLKADFESREVKRYIAEVITNKDLNAVQVAQDILDMAESSEIDKDHIDHVIDSFMADMHKPLEKEYDYYKFDSDLGFLNRIMGTLRKGELNLVGARSGVGKTLFVMQNLSKWSEELTTLFISREMRSESLWKRILVRETGIDNTCFREKRFTDEQWKAIRRVNSMFKGRDLYLNARISTISEIRRKLYETKAQLLVVDYLQIMESEGKHNSREREVAWLSRHFKKIALEFDIPVVVLTQLNDSSGDNRPTGERDVRESKAPYQDSDNAVYLHKPNEDNIREWVKRGVISEETLEKFELMEVNVTKQRDGIVGNNLCRHIKDELRFKEIQPWR